jgi:hypothetical protein
MKPIAGVLMITASTLNTVATDNHTLHPVYFMNVSTEDGRGAVSGWHWSARFALSNDSSLSVALAKWFIKGRYRRMK